ncbi:hypothetical protein SFRURICE_014463, partial [Spodoptera frugiperda]
AHKNETQKTHKAIKTTLDSTNERFSQTQRSFTSKNTPRKLLYFNPIKFTKSQAETILGFSFVSWVRMQTYKFTYTSHPDSKQQFADHTKSCSVPLTPANHATQNKNLWTTQRVAIYWNRTRYILRTRWLPSHRTSQPCGQNQNIVKDGVCSGPAVLLTLRLFSERYKSFTHILHVSQNRLCHDDFGYFSFFRKSIIELFLAVRLVRWLDNWLPRNVSWVRFPHEATLCVIHKLLFRVRVKTHIKTRAPARLRQAVVLWLTLAPSVLTAHRPQAASARCDDVWTDAR